MSFEKEFIHSINAILIWFVMQDTITQALLFAILLFSSSERPILQN